MSEPLSAVAARAEEAVAEKTSYAPYAQLVKMLLPRSLSFAVYDASGKLTYSSSGYEKPEVRDLADKLLPVSYGAAPSRLVQRTQSGIHAFVASLHDLDRSLGCAIVELGQSRDVWEGAVVEGLLKPVIRCLENRLALELPRAPHGGARSDALDLLLKVENDDTGDSRPFQRLMQHTVQHMRCTAGALVMTEKNLQVCCASRKYSSEVTSELLDRTQKNLLAWAQLNNRPMIVNRVNTHAGTLPHKILSCPIRLKEDSVGGVIALFRDPDEEDFDIRDVRLLEFTARRAICISQSRSDPLTGLVTRQVFENNLQQSLAQPVDKRHVLLYIDVDQLGIINEKFGYHAGDEVLERLAESILGPLQADETASRLGGDRFAVHLIGRSLQDAEKIATGISRSVAQLRYLDGEDSVGVSLSIGVSELSRNEQALAHDMARAELACKLAKSKGPGTVIVHRGEPAGQPAQARVYASVSIRQALRDDNFVLEAQPVTGLSVSTGELMGHEVLVRMRDLDGQLLAPAKFLDAARHYGLMPELDRWVVTNTIRKLRDSGRNFAEQQNHFVLNLSVQSVLNEGFADFVLDELLRARLPAQMFRFELAEAAAAAHMREAERFMRALREAGCSVGLDDFGAGLSSFADLRHLPVQYLKIDGALIRRILIDRYAESLVVGIARAAEVLGMYTVAEHVETEDLARRLRYLDINYGQGYHFGRPRSLQGVIDPI